MLRDRLKTSGSVPSTKPDVSPGRGEAGVLRGAAFQHEARRQVSLPASKMSKGPVGQLGNSCVYINKVGTFGVNCARLADSALQASLRRPRPVLLYGR